MLGLTTINHKGKGKGKADDLYRGSMQFENHYRTALQYPLVHCTLCRCQQYGAFSMKALARYQIILLGEQRHITPCLNKKQAKLFLL